VGGSLVAEHGLGGHNPLEAAVWGVPVLFGPNMKKFPGIRRELLEAGAGIELESAANLTPTLERLWSRPGEVETRGRAAAALVQRHRGSIETTMSRLLALLPDSE
jgi:3-deoxy-D-manno-octulosonic-acid transferase